MRMRKTVITKERKDLLELKSLKKESEEERAGLGFGLQ